VELGRLEFISSFALGILAAPLAAEAQQGRKVYRIGVLDGGSRQLAVSARLLPPALRELGYVEGQNLTIEWRFTEGDAARLPEFATELVRLNVDVLLAGFMPEILAAKRGPRPCLLS